VSFGGINSSLYNVSHGVGQGRVLSTFMFLVYIDDLLNEICKSNDGLLLGDIHLLSILLADDTVLLSNSLHSLQSLLFIVERYAYNWILHYNQVKVCL
jgi:hypothetical protein